MNGNPLANIPPVVKNILIICILMLIGNEILKGQLNEQLNEWLALYYPESDYFRPYQFVTHIFMHADFMHLLFNMFAFWMFGRVLEQVWGSQRFFIYFIVTALGASLLHLFVQWIELAPMKAAVASYIENPNLEAFDLLISDYFPHYYDQVYTKNIALWTKDASNPFYSQQSILFINDLMSFKLDSSVVGASGAVFGVLLAFGMLFPNMELMLLFPPIPIKAKYLVMAYGAFELYMGFANNPSDNVAHFAHLGGMLFGFFLVKYWQKDTKKFY